jgi:hypothetical protein
MRRRVDVAPGIVQHEVFEMNEAAVDPERGTGISKRHALEQTLADRRLGNSLVEAHERGAGVCKRL